MLKPLSLLTCLWLSHCRPSSSPTYRERAFLDGVEAWVSQHPRNLSSRWVVLSLFSFLPSPPLFFSLTHSLSLTHTHTHTHTPGRWPELCFCELMPAKTHTQLTPLCPPLNSSVLPKRYPSRTVPIIADKAWSLSSQRSSGLHFCSALGRCVTIFLSLVSKEKLMAAGQLRCACCVAPYRERESPVFGGAASLAVSFHCLWVLLSFLFLEILLQTDIE